MRWWFSRHYGFTNSTSVWPTLLKSIWFWPLQWFLRTENLSNHCFPHFEASADCLPGFVKHLQKKPPINGVVLLLVRLEHLDKKIILCMSPKIYSHGGINGTHSYPHIRNDFRTTSRKSLASSWMTRRTCTPSTPMRPWRRACCRRPCWRWHPRSIM